MYNQQPVPFYMTYPVAAMSDNEQIQDREAQIMKSYYSQLAVQIQERVEHECDKMEYEGSMMYDEYPDKLMMEEVCVRIGNELQDEADSSEMEVTNRNFYRHPNYRWGFDDLIGVLLLNEMHRRRCRYGRCRRHF